MWQFSHKCLEFGLLPGQGIQHNYNYSVSSTGYSELCLLLLKPILRLQILACKICMQHTARLSLLEYMYLNKVVVHSVVVDNHSCNVADLASPSYGAVLLHHCCLQCLQEHKRLHMYCSGVFASDLVSIYVILCQACLDYAGIATI